MRKIIGLIGGVFSFITIVSFVIWMFPTIINPTSENISKGAELIAKSAIPWWITLIQILAPLGLIGAILIIIVLYYESHR